MKMMMMMVMKRSFQPSLRNPPGWAAQQHRCTRQQLDVIMNRLLSGGFRHETNLNGHHHRGKRKSRAWTTFAEDWRQKNGGLEAAERCCEQDEKTQLAQSSYISETNCVQDVFHLAHHWRYELLKSWKGRVADARCRFPLRLISEQFNINLHFPYLVRIQRQSTTCQGNVLNGETSVHTYSTGRKYITSGCCFYFSK